MKCTKNGLNEVKKEVINDSDLGVVSENIRAEIDVVAENKAIEKKLKRKKSILKSQAKRYIIDFCRHEDFQELFDWIREGLENQERSKQKYSDDKLGEYEKECEIEKAVAVDMRIKLNVFNDGECWTKRSCEDKE